MNAIRTVGLNEDNSEPYDESAVNGLERQCDSLFGKQVWDACRTHSREVTGEFQHGSETLQVTVSIEPSIYARGLHARSAKYCIKVGPSVGPVECDGTSCPNTNTRETHA